MSLPINQIICGDCLEAMKGFPDNCVDLVLTDPPYGITACKWDSVIPFQPMWKQLKRLIKSNGAIVITTSQPFTTALIASNIKMFKYCWVWDKIRMTGHLNAKKRPMVKTEDVCVFYSKQCVYNPQMTKGKTHLRGSWAGKHKSKCQVYGKYECQDGNANMSNLYYPQNIIQFRAELQSTHPTQKPVALMEYLIKTYTNKGEMVLDFTCGSGTTCKAAQNLNRQFIGIDISEEYCEIARQRIEAVETGVPVKEQRKGQMALFGKEK